MEHWDSPGIGFQFLLFIGQSADWEKKLLEEMFHSSVKVVWNSTGWRRCCRSVTEAVQGRLFFNVENVVFLLIHTPVR